MPWNDLYATGRRLSPGSMYPPAVISARRYLIRTQWAVCRGQKKRYQSCSPVGGMTYIREVYRRCLLRNESLILHIHNPTLALLGLFVRIFCPDTRIIGNLHTDWRYLRLHHRLGLRLLAAISERFVCVSKASLASIPEAIRERMSARGKLAVIHNGIDFDSMDRVLSMSPVDARESPVSDRSGKVTAIVVARMVAAKNCLYILRLLAMTKAIDRLIWYGDGPQRKVIETEIHRLGIAARISLLGSRPRDEVFLALASSTLYLSASRWEGIGVANLEAAALGCTPFLSAIPAHEEIAEILQVPTYPLDDPGTWVAGIEHFLGQPEDMRARMRLAISTRARENFDLNNTVSRYFDVYRVLAVDTYG